MTRIRPNCHHGSIPSYHRLISYKNCQTLRKGGLWTHCNQGNQSFLLTCALSRHWFAARASTNSSRNSSAPRYKPRTVQSSESERDPRGDPRGHSLIDNKRRADWAEISLGIRIASQTHCQYLPLSLNLCFLNAQAHRGERNSGTTEGQHMEKK